MTEIKLNVVNNPPKELEARFIIFLDFDGVLCTSRQAYAVGDRGVLGCLDPVGLDFLNRICREHKIWVIISSTWRIGATCSKFHDMFKATGHFDLVKSLYWNDYATQTSKTGHRGEQIEQWLKANDAIVKDYLILDDETDMLDYQMSRLVQTDMRNGILFDNYIDIEKRIKAAFNEEYHD